MTRYIYIRRLKFWKLLQTLHPRLLALPPLWSPDRLRHRQRPPTTGLHHSQWKSHRRCRRSEFVAKLGYELDLFVHSLILILAKKIIATVLTTNEINLST